MKHDPRCVTKKTGIVPPIIGTMPFLPINSAVELVDISRKRIVVRIHATNRELLVEHVPKHNQDTIAEAIENLFAKTAP